MLGLSLAQHVKINSNTNELTMRRCSGRRCVKMTIIGFSSLYFEDLFVPVRPGWEQLMAPSSVAAALLQGTLLCSYFWAQIISKAVFLWFKSVFRQCCPCCGCHSLCTEVEEQSCVSAHWSNFSRKSCSIVLTALHCLRPSSHSLALGLST